ncbi:hypothetical protein [uncultured Dokdonia sp.]|uniref:hypothetical protein n=1 Tax=uncultured Dokdonia sp. TaxID=575653 RepID=UPI002618668F|nr:hypothetical protein [uncultured Dokdonia sp.]
MSKQASSLKDDFEKELEKLQSDTVLSPQYRKRKTIIWLIRTIIACILFVIFWKHTWVRWALIAYVPLNLFSLFSIYGSKAIMNRSIQKTRRKIEDAERHFEE